MENAHAQKDCPSFRYPGKKRKPQEKDYKLMDGFGIFLLITPTNSKLWRFD
jgi:hypothetical protein